MIKQIRIKNFKSIKEQTLDNLPRIVGIWGKNGEGKSSLLQSIIWTMKNQGELQGNGLNFESYKNIVFGHDIGGMCEVNIIEDNGDSVLCKYNGGSVAGATLEKPEKSWESVRYFPPWRHISSRYSNIREKVTEDLGNKAYNIHTYIHWFLHQIVADYLRGDTSGKIIYEKIGTWAKKIGLGDILDQSFSYELVMGTYKDEVLGIEVPIVDGGFGGNSFLPIILEGYSFRNGILIIEEPEISLHPAAQAEIWDLFIEWAKERGHQIFFTSHSEYLPKRIARSLRDGKIQEGDVRVLLCKKSREGGSEYQEITKDDLVTNLDKNNEIIPDLTYRS